MATISSREFNRDTAAAKRTADTEPVVVTDRGKPAHVLMSWAEYRRLTAQGATPMDLIADDDAADIALDLPPRALPRPVSLD